jgi:uncharacterized spore protein YtfJ
VKAVTMNATDLLQTISETVRTAANAKSVYGEPVTVNGKTVVPVAKVAYGFGAGVGPRKRGEGPDPGGGGGGVRAFPAGALEITDTRTRFVPYGNATRTAAQVAIALGTGILIGALAMRRRT